MLKQEGAAGEVTCFPVNEPVVASGFLTCQMKRAAGGRDGGKNCAIKITRVWCGPLGRQATRSPTMVLSDVSGQWTAVVVSTKRLILEMNIDVTLLYWKCK